MGTAFGLWSLEFLFSQPSIFVELAEFGSVQGHPCFGMELFSDGVVSISLVSVVFWSIVFFLFLQCLCQCSSVYSLSRSWELLWYMRSWLFLIAFITSCCWLFY